MRILFCKISSMKYYKGACEQDIPVYGGKFVEENGYGHEELNFFPVDMEGLEEPECVGFVEPKSNRGVRNTLHIEKIEGCDAMRKEPLVDDVLVVWCAKRDYGDVTVVGWYKHATVWRDLQDWTLMYEDGAEEATSSFLPQAERDRAIAKLSSAAKSLFISSPPIFIYSNSLQKAREYTP